MSKSPPKDDHGTFRYRGNLYRVRSRLRLGQRIYLVIDEDFNDRFSHVLKVFDPRVQRMRVVRFRERGAFSEMKLIQRAADNNRNLPEVLDFGRSDDGDYLILPWIGEHDLKHYLDRGRQEGRPFFVAAEAYRMIVDLVKGLRRLHQASIVHADLKPENLAVVSGNRLIMIDFGISWTGERALNRTRGLTRKYAAPEQLRNEPLVDYRADQFSVSMILYEMLTNEVPYDKLGGRAAEYDHPPYTNPSRLNRQVWHALDRVVTKGLALDKNKRFETTPQWLDAMEEAAPKTVRPITHWIKEARMFLSTRAAPFLNKLRR